MAKVFPILARLHDAGIPMWYDEGIDLSSHWRNVIATNIVKCTAFLSFISPQILSGDPNKLSFPEKEINLAIIKDKRIVSIFLEETALTPGLELELPNWQAIFKYHLEDSVFFSRVIKACKKLLSLS